jgi:hypothetical protein
MEIAQMIKDGVPADRHCRDSAGWRPAATPAQFILLGADTRAGAAPAVMKFGYEHVKPMCDELLDWMAKKNFETLADFQRRIAPVFHLRTRSA